MNKSLPHSRFFKKSLLAFFARDGRKGLPWSKIGLEEIDQGFATGYKTYVSEIMLQQTTVGTVLKRFPPFVEQFPSFEALAHASDDEVMKVWEGLGYYRRARFLHHTAKEVVSVYHGTIPKKRLDRLNLKGVGPSTASALGAFVYHLPEPIWDTNVQRVFARFFGEDLYNQINKNWFEKTKDLMPQKGENVAIYTQALMDLGATVCIPKTPLCHKCPLKKHCVFFQQISSVASQVTPPTNVVRKKTAKKIIDKKWVLVFNTQKEIFLMPPSQEGVWPGLWQLPDQEVLPLPQNTPLLTEGRHELSHRTIHYSITAISLSSDMVLPSHGRWVSQEQCNLLAFPKPLAHFWNTFAPWDNFCNGS